MLNWHLCDSENKFGVLKEAKETNEKNTMHINGIWIFKCNCIIFVEILINHGNFNKNK